MARESLNPTLPEPRLFSMRLPRPFWVVVTAVVLMAVATALSVGMPIYQEQAAFRRFWKLDPNLCHKESRLPYWLQGWVGEDFLRNEIGRVWQANLSESEVSDADVPFIRSFSGIRILELANTKITDRGIARLGTLRDLAELDLSGTQVTDDGLQPLRRFPALAVLWLSDTNIGDDGLMHCAEIPSLVSITIDALK